VVWTIYQAPKDFPDGFVTRPWTITGRGPEPGMAQLSMTLEQARQNVPQGLYRMDRQPGDDPAVLETWI
jgi:hypothetical protein